MVCVDRRQNDIGVGNREGPARSWRPVHARHIDIRAAAHLCYLDMVQKGLKARYLEDGYVIVRNLVSEQEMKDLTEACTRAEVLVREAGWPFRRSVGKQFPPYSDEPDSWGIQHVMHPALGEPAFARWYSSDAICDVAKELLGCSEEDLQMGQFVAKRVISLT